MNNPRQLAAFAAGPILGIALTLSLSRPTAPSIPVVPPTVPKKIDHLQPEGGFDYATIRDISIWDLRGRTEVGVSDRTRRASPVNYINYLHIVRQSESARMFVAHYATSGDFIDLRCITDDCEVYKEDSSSHPDEQQYMIRADLARHPVGKEFLLVVEATYWNAFRNDKANDVSTYTDSDVAMLEELGVFVLFPESKRFQKAWQTVRGIDEPKSREVGFRGTETKYEDRDGRFIYWSIIERTPNKHYTINWEW